MADCVPNPTLQRLPAYLHLLKRLRAAGKENVSCNVLAAELNMNPVSVRKDIAAVSSTGGRPKLGYVLDTLIIDVEKYLGYSELHRAALVGVGHLGSALLAYPGFSAYGIEIAAAFDCDPARIGTVVAGKTILDAKDVAAWCRANSIKLGILTVPASSAQSACDSLAEGGVKGIWSFAPTHLRAPEGVLIQREDMAIPLAVLSKHIDHEE